MTLELTPEMRAAMGQAILRARRYLIDNFPREGEWLLTTAIAVSFTDGLRNGCQPDRQRRGTDGTGAKSVSPGRHATRWRRLPA